MQKKYNWNLDPVKDTSGFCHSDRVRESKPSPCDLLSPNSNCTISNWIVYSFSKQRLVHDSIKTTRCYSEKDEIHYIHYNINFHCAPFFLHFWLSSKCFKGCSNSTCADRLAKWSTRVLSFVGFCVLSSSSFLLFIL